MVSKEHLLEFVKQYNDYDDTDIFDKKLKLLINAECGKLLAEGIPNGDMFTDENEIGDTYCLCIAIGILIGLNKDIDFAMYNALLYATKNTLRCYVTAKQQ